MLSEKLEIWKENEYSYQYENGFKPDLLTYILAGNKERGAVLICPGGGYSYTSEREAEPIAMQFNAAGFHAFVLNYSVAPVRHPQPLLDVCRAMCIIRENASKWKVSPQKIAVCGFSAGGHLAVSLGVYWEKQYILESLQVKSELVKPNALILCYPVITSGQYAHRGSFNNLLGECPQEELLKEMSLELHVNERMPPVFLWHTFADQSVPLENTLFFAQELRKYKVPFELHVYPEGGHGLSLATKETENTERRSDPHIATWMGLCTGWLTLLFG